MIRDGGRSTAGVAAGGVAATTGRPALGPRTTARSALGPRGIGVAGVAGNGARGRSEIVAAAVLCPCPDQDSMMSDQASRSATRNSDAVCGRASRSLDMPRRIRFSIAVGTVT